jgi:hypothetical protein
VRAVEHLKTLCCLGLPPESAMIAVVPLLHEIIPHGWTRLALVAPEATMTAAYQRGSDRLGLALAGPQMVRQRLLPRMEAPLARAILSLD